MKETEGLIKSGLNSSADQAYGELSSGVGDSAGLLTQPDNFNSNIAYGDQAMSSAIRNKYSKPFQVQQQGMENKMKLDARNVHFQKMLTAQQLASEEVKLNFQKEMIKYKQKMAKRAQRNQIIGQVLGIGGAVAGGAMAGPGGAIAGNQAGQAAGGAALSNT